MTGNDSERPKAFKGLQTYQGGSNKGLHSNAWYIYPEDTEGYSRAWYAPIIALDNEVLWQGEPQQSSDVAREEARKYLALKMKELFNPLVAVGGLRGQRRPDQLF